MYELTTIKGLIKRGRLAAFAIAMLLSLSAVSAPAQAQELASFFAYEGFRGGVTVGAASGQTVRLRIATTDNHGRLLIGTDGGVYRAVTFNGHVRVFDGSTGALLQSRELTSLTMGVHWIDINRDDLRAAGEPVTGRIQLWIQIVIDPLAAGPGRAEGTGVLLLTPTFEVMNTYTGVTTVQGGLTKLGSKRLVLQGDGTY